MNARAHRGRPGVPSPFMVQPSRVAGRRAPLVAGRGRYSRPAIRHPGCGLCTGTEAGWLPSNPHAMSGRTEVRRVPKPWGHETIWASNDLYVGKILHITAGHALSKQYHRVKDETVYLLSGELKYCVQLDGSDRPEDVFLKPGEAFRITPGTIHYMEAVTDCDVLEAST